MYINPNQLESWQAYTQRGLFGYPQLNFDLDETEHDYRCPWCHTTPVDSETEQCELCRESDSLNV